MNITCIKIFTVREQAYKRGRMPQSSICDPDTWNKVQDLTSDTDLSGYNSQNSAVFDGATLVAEFETGVVQDEIYFYAQNR